MGLEWQRRAQAEDTRVWCVVGLAEPRVDAADDVEVVREPAVGSGGAKIGGDSAEKCDVFGAAADAADGRHVEGFADAAQAAFVHIGRIGKSCVAHGSRQRGIPLSGKARGPALGFGEAENVGAGTDAQKA